jgi:hypothetical protein
MPRSIDSLEISRGVESEAAIRTLFRPVCLLRILDDFVHSWPFEEWEDDVRSAES